MTSQLKTLCHHGNVNNDGKIFFFIKKGEPIGEPVLQFLQVLRTPRTTYILIEFAPYGSLNLEIAIFHPHLQRK